MEARALEGTLKKGKLMYCCYYLNRDSCRSVAKTKYQ